VETVAITVVLVGLALAGLPWPVNAVAGTALAVVVPLARRAGKDLW
jgi:hypothetical protein